MPGREMPRFSISNGRNPFITENVVTRIKIMVEIMLIASLFVLSLWDKIGLPSEHHEQ